MKVALWQTRPRHHLADALGRVAQDASNNGADILLTPEMFLGGYNVGIETVLAHASKSRQVLERLQKIAQCHRIALVAGLAMPADPSPNNTCVLIDHEGNLLHRYAKTHLFGPVDQKQFTAGDEISKVVTLNGWRVGLAICYDVEFPEIPRALAIKGAQLIPVPTANMTPFDSIAERLIPARAEESAVYLAYCNYVGAEGGFAYNGLSCVCGPDGNDLARANTCSDGLIYADIDAQTLSERRQKYTHLSDRRDDLY